MYILPLTEIQRMIVLTFNSKFFFHSYHSKRLNLFNILKFKPPGKKAFSACQPSTESQSHM